MPAPRAAVLADDPAIRRTHVMPGAGHPMRNGLDDNSDRAPVRPATRTAQKSVSVRALESSQRRAAASGSVAQGLTPPMSMSSVSAGSARSQSWQ